MADYILTQMLKINEKKRIPMKKSWYSLHLQVVFQKTLSLQWLYALNSVYLKNIDFLKHGRLNSHKNAWN